MTERDDTTCNRILDAAGAVFAEHGFEKATVREICRRAGVNLAAVNYHFRDKRRLYAETIQHAHRLAAVQVPMPNWSPSTAPAQKLREFIRTMIHRMLVVKLLPWQTRLMMREFAQPTGVCQELAENYIRPHFEILLGILDQLIPAETPPHRRYKLGFSIVGQCMFYHLHAPVIEILLPRETLAEHFQPAQLAEHVAEVMLAAFDKEPLFKESFVSDSSSKN
ncbi:MAG: CerR family C-terminal domain-containing protein [Planctomycetota bacterium]|nr:CerR family C-terminal domain-containing protein [Planctomycetota bacterium]